MAVDPENQSSSIGDAVTGLNALKVVADQELALRVYKMSLIGRARSVAVAGSVREDMYVTMPRHRQKIRYCGTNFIELEPGSGNMVALLEAHKRTAQGSILGVSLLLISEETDPSLPEELAFFSDRDIDVEYGDLPKTVVLKSLMDIVTAIEENMEKPNENTPSALHVDPYYAQHALELSRALRDKGLVSEPKPLESRKL